MFLLTRNRFLLEFMENKIIEPQKRVNFVLEKNREILKPLINNQKITSSKPKRTMPTAWRKRMQVISFARGCRVIEDRLKKSIAQTSKNISEKYYNFSEPFSSLTKTFVGLLGKTVIEETGAKIGKFERVLSTVKPTSKFSDSPVKRCSKPLKNKLQVHIIQNVTPLDDLLTLSSEN